MHSRCRTSSTRATPTLMSVEDGPTVFWTSLYVSNHPVVNMPPGCNVFTFFIWNIYTCMYVCLYICMYVIHSGKLWSSFMRNTTTPATQGEWTIPQQSYSKPSSFLISTLTFRPRSSLYPFVFLPLCFHSFFLLHWYTQVLYLWGYAPLPALGANWVSGTEQVWAVLSKLRGSLRVKVVSTCEWVGWSTTLNYCSCMCMLKEQLHTHAKYHGFITFELPYDIFPPACPLPVPCLSPFRESTTFTVVWIH